MQALKLELEFLCPFQILIAISRIRSDFFVFPSLGIPCIQMTAPAGRPLERTYSRQPRSCLHVQLTTMVRSVDTGLGDPLFST